MSGGIVIGREALGDFDAVARREWLVANGLGGFACGTIAGANTRRYHGLLVAALHPPLDRTVMVAKLDAVVSYRGRRYELATNEYGGGTVAPRGHVHLDSFKLDGSLPVWTWLVCDALIEQRVWMAHGANTTYVRYSVLRADEAVRIELTPLCTYRDYHSHHRGYRETLVTPVEGGVQVDSYFGARAYRIVAERGSCSIAPEWHWNIRHRAESERGLDDVEDLFRPAVFEMSLESGESGSVIMTAEHGSPVPAEASLGSERMRQRALLDQAPARLRDSTHRQLILAADQFVVARRPYPVSPSQGTTLIAGYPWFGDWGRDTMIALPGLALVTGRHDVAADVLRTFAQYLSDGMLPNRFPDGNEAPEYNTVDATLWYVVAIDDYVRRSGDRQLLRDLYPALQSIVQWHRRGTRHGIKVDERDGLLAAGEPSVQLTWMDAKIGDWVVTPRTGKAVEINALWFNVLSIMRDFAQLLDDAPAAREHASDAERVARSFNERFWFAEGGYLYDVVDTDRGPDSTLRPNQLFAISLRHPLLDNGRARRVVDLCAQELWTPVGLRSLATGDPAYAGRYVGAPHERDAVYHQGTVWSWLLGPFALAHYRAHGDARRALEYLNGIDAHLRDACIGQISEIFDGDAPFTPRGCFAQAWGVAEILRAWSDINDSEDTDANHTEERKAVAALRR